MKQTILVIAVLLGMTFTTNAQKYAFIDSEYILKNIPAYESAQDQLNQASKKWQAEVEAIMAEVKTMYQNYQNELVFLSDEMKLKRENEIIKKEKDGQEQKKSYFGPEGELFKKRESLMKPIQDELYNAVKELADEKQYAVIFDKASSTNIIYYNPKHDVSDDVLTKMGYSN